jgi:hypothetical protein
MSKRRSKMEIREEARKQGHWDSEGLKAERRLMELPRGAGDQEIAEAIANWEIADHLGCWSGYHMRLTVTEEARHGVGQNADSER